MAILVPSRIVYFDFDKTLFDTSKLINELIFPRLATEVKLPLPAVQDWGKLFRHTLPKATAFSPEAFAEWLSHQIAVDEEQVTACFYQPDVFEAAVFPETRSVLQQLSQRFILGIFSEGVEKWQQTKIEKSKLKEFFEQENSIISQNKLDAETKAKLKPNSVVVDDNFVVVADIAQTPNLTPIWLQRKVPTEAPQQPTVTTIRSLTELVSLLDDGR